MKKFEKPVFGIATAAMHKLGDISRDEPDYCLFVSEDETNYYGHWIEGFGFVNVAFPKTTSKICSPELAKELSEQTIVIT